MTWVGVGDKLADEARIRHPCVLVNAVIPASPLTAPSWFRSVLVLGWVGGGGRCRASQVALVSGKESACQAGDLVSIPALGRSPGGEHGNPLQYSCLEKPMDRGAWWATVHGVTKSRTGLKWLSMHSHPGLNGKLHHYLGPDGEARRRFLLRSRRKFWKSFPDSKGEGLEKNEGPLRRS